MISNDENGTYGQSSARETVNKGSWCTVRAGPRCLPLFPAVIMCLGLLNTVLILTAVVIGIYCGKVSEVSSPYQITVQGLIVEVRHLQIMQAEVIRAEEEAQQALKKELRSHQLLKLQLERNKTLSDSLRGQIETLQVERALLQSNVTDIQESCGRCLAGWRLLNKTCYFHSKSASDTLKNWPNSKEDCISRGASLAVIDSWEEQRNLFEFLPKLDPSIWPWWSRPGGVWIGLTDTETEGSWVWLNNETVVDGGYWIQGEPNNVGVMGENCAAFLNIRDPRKTWFDANCQENKEWLCEMEPK